MKNIYNDSKTIKHLTSTQVILIGFLIAILVGALILMLPIATVEGETTTFGTALFTSTTSICVTGLVVVDTFSHWTLFGQIVILILIQIGGFGVITLYSILMLALGKRFSLRTRTLIQDYYNLDSIKGLIKFLKKVVKGSLLVEFIGALGYMIRFIPDFGLFKGIWASIFNAVSAFCNAGMDVLGPSSLIPYRSDVLVNFITITLIILGGIGYVVWFDVINTVRDCHRHRWSLSRIWKKFNEHTKLVIILTACLIVLGSVTVLIFEWDNPDTIGNFSVFDKVMASIFQSVTFRTAGFATIPQESLKATTCMVGCVLMFIGGSPVGTAGGVKTMTIFVVILNAFSFIGDKNDNVVFGKRVSYKLINKATAIITFSLTLTMALIIFLIHFEGLSALDASYEIFSATGTVGLSRAVTPHLHAIGKSIVIIAMYAGRIGILSMALFFATSHSDQNEIKYSKGCFIVG
ncbi:TrkH family potassium uptake protein [Lachnospira pectinoschiza]|uniref:Trk system potassium uptake protein TrkH n=1 Tax=Lachnospira pectinoschiza TaxID=28052 RepID=A0A1G9WNQ8_9FIRM|nr:potassium transporter TrkG [Lachnospira pectinoschiza]SDM85715.1 trk system potassium uptake protein TrkH [Lachnospira pectinoschiza]